jgi:hypothetical protein
MLPAIFYFQLQAPTTASAATTRLFHWVDAGNGGNGKWEIVSENAVVTMYDAHEDSNNKAPEWHFELEGAQDAPDVLVDDSFEFKPKENAAFFPVDGKYYALHFPSAPLFHAFSQKYNKALFENTYGLEKNEDNELKIYGADFLPRLGGETKTSREAWVEDMEIDDAPTQDELARKSTPMKERVAAEEKDIISGVVLGGGDRSFLLNESGNVGVMRNIVGGVEDTGVTFSFNTPPRLTIPTGTPTSGRGGAGTPGSALTPSKALLMDSERRMNMLTPGSSSLYHASIETGQVVREFSFNKDGVAVPMKDIAADTKSSQMEAHNTFLSLDQNRLARWDLRDPTGLVQDMSSPAALSYVGGKDYARGTKFSCMATSGDGYVVVGSSDGKVRLYSEKTLSQAKTAIPSLGGPITAVDVTYDGKWVLATTSRYLMVVKTTYKERDSHRELCGFTSKMGREAPAPRLLRLKVEDVARTGGAPLEKARFTWITERGRQERWIIASCGNYTVLWNFRSVKVAEPEVVSVGGLTTVTSYHLIPKTEHVVDSLFMHDKYSRAAAGAGESAMVVVTDKKVYTAADDGSDEDEEEAGTPTLRGGGRRIW